ncbi:hypothetical protein D039_4161B, partial [Vibrio parahaemolyticus EKP-028]
IDQPNDNFNHFLHFY